MKEVSNDDLRDLLARARAGTLPTRRRVKLPSGRKIDNWNVLVLGSAFLLLWARRGGSPDVAARETADMAHLVRELRAAEEARA